MSKCNEIECHIKELNKILIEVIKKIGKINIANSEQLPFGWRKSAKGRTVWRIVEEIINQNLEKYSEEFNSYTFSPPTSEVGVYDFKIQLKSCKKDLYVNIKSAVKGRKQNKDDISKANKLVKFFNEEIEKELYIATFEINFNDDMSIEIENCYVFPIMWLSDIYVNPSNNGNLQSSKYKNINDAVKRTSLEFLNKLKDEIEIANCKKLVKQEF